MPKLTSNEEYCSIARALELLGERWTLHIVRDLLSGPKRFGELEDLVVGVTPKWLTARLRALESGGVVERDGRLYRLTSAGERLRPVLEELLIWSSTHDARPPRPGEKIIPAHDMWALEVFLNRIRPPVSGPVRWAIHLKDDDDHVIAFDGQRWTWLPSEQGGEVEVTTTARRWSILLYLVQTGKPSPANHYGVTGNPDRVAEFRALTGITGCAGND
jgi:DNA-binding HxlR family transcriptional regulator